MSLSVLILYSVYHTLDLVLIHGLTVSDLEVCDAFFSDHMPVIFEISLPGVLAKPCGSVRRGRIVNPSTADQFSSVFNLNHVSRCRNTTVKDLCAGFNRPR